MLWNLKGLEGVGNWMLKPPACAHMHAHTHTYTCTHTLVLFESVMENMGNGTREGGEGRRGKRRRGDEKGEEGRRGTG